MRILKLGILSIVFFFLLITGFSLFIPSHVRISRAINIGASKDSIREQIADIKKWKNWYPGFDTLAITSVKEEGGRTVVAKVGNGAISITAITDFSVTAESEAAGKRTVLQRWNAIGHQVNDTITLQWTMDFKLKWYPWEKFASLMFEQRYSPVMEYGLSAIRQVLEK